jgi:hypothetical protein
LIGSEIPGGEVEWPIGYVCGACVDLRKPKWFECQSNYWRLKGVEWMIKLKFLRLPESAAFVLGVKV